jgi:hypothetical protein
MQMINRIFVGVDSSGGRFPFTLAAIDEKKQLMSIWAGEVDEVFGFFNDHPSIIAAINAPSRPNKGEVRKKIEAEKMKPGQLRKVDMRMAEFELIGRGISISQTASCLENCATWMQIGFNFHHDLEKKGFKPFPSEEAPYQSLETNPYAAFSVLLGQLPLPKPTLEGRLQRHLVLYEQGMGINDPMEFFEEITRRRLIKGDLPCEKIFSPQELDALVAAFTAFIAVEQPENISWIGDRQEGQIILPVADLKKMYL